jgi:hypothetical protein
MKLTRKQKIERQQRLATERAAERVMGPIRDAIDAGELVITPVASEVEVVCEHGTAMDVHCCDCHSGFLFDSTPTVNRDECR